MSHFSVPAEILVQIFELAIDDDGLFDHTLPTFMSESCWELDRYEDNWTLVSPANALHRKQQRTYAAIKVCVSPVPHLTLLTLLARHYCTPVDNGTVLAIIFSSGSCSSWSPRNCPPFVLLLIAMPRSGGMLGACISIVSMQHVGAHSQSLKLWSFRSYTSAPISSHSPWIGL